MKVSCNHCGKKYVIPDDKVAGKTSVRIRCKECQSLVTVVVSHGASPSPQGVPTSRPSGSGHASSPAASPGPWADEQTRAMPAMDMSATWYAMVRGKQVGPLHVRELSEKISSGEVTLRTYLWKPGMGDWKCASDVPEVSPLFAGVSVGAAATGPAQPTPDARGPATRATAAMQRDVALSNEVPSPEVAPRRSSTSTPSGPVSRSSVAGPLEAPRPEADHEPAPRPEARANARPDAQAAPLNELFGDLDGIGETPAPSQEHSTSSPSEQPTSSPPDPFAQLSEGDGVQAPPIGEATRFFIAQAGVNKRNPPWKIALFAALVIGAPLGLVFLLQSFHIVELPTVAHTNEDGTVTQEPFFSPGGMSGLKDLLTGEAKRRQAEAERRRKEQEAAALAKKQQQQQGTGTTDDPPPKPRPQDPLLAAFYQEDDKKTIGPKLRKTDPDDTGAVVNASGLSPEVVSKVVADKSKAFQLCIDQALHRNPNLAVGNVTVVLNVGASGAVKSASIEPKKHEGSDWAQCMMGAARRIVFPASDGETQVELPFKVGVSMGP